MTVNIRQEEKKSMHENERTNEKKKKMKTRFFSSDVFIVGEKSIVSTSVFFQGEERKKNPRQNYRDTHFSESFADLIDHARQLNGSVRIRR